MAVLNLFDNATTDNTVRNRVYREEFYWVESATEGKCVCAQLHDLIYARFKRMWLAS